MTTPTHTRNTVTFLCVVLSVETPLSVLYGFDLDILVAITFHPMIIVQTLGTSVLQFETPGKFNCQASFSPKEVFIRIVLK